MMTRQASKLFHAFDEIRPRDFQHLDNVELNLMTRTLEEWNLAALGEQVRRCYETDGDVDLDDDDATDPEMEPAP